MSENEIKPVAWRFKDYLPVLADGYAYGYTHNPESPVADEPLYDQPTIDRLTAERDDWRRQAQYETDVAEAARQEIERIKAECDEAQRKLSVAVSEGKALVADAERLREVLRITASVAIVQLFDAAPEDVEAEFSLDELQQIVEVTSPLRDLGVSVESQYRIAIDAAKAEGGV